MGLASTDMVYFASGLFDEAAAMITASHNPPEYNGIKFSRAGAKGVSMNRGLAGIRGPGPGAGGRRSGLGTHRFDAGDHGCGVAVCGVFARTSRYRTGPPASHRGGCGPMAWAGYTVPAVLGTEAGLPGLPLEIDPMYFELDGTFPNHEANPLEPKNLVDLQARVVETGADMGLAFDGDADRCFVVDERGEPVTPSVIGSIVARREITRVQALGEDQPVVLHNLICSQVVPETITAEGGIAHRTAVGHSLIKDDMATTNAVFGAEHSAHYYFRDFFGADSGLLAALHVIAELGSQDQALSTLASRYMPYHQTGERNFRVENVGAVMENIRNEFAAEATIDTLDGLSVQGPMSGPRHVVGECPRVQYGAAASGQRGSSQSREISGHCGPVWMP